MSISTVNSVSFSLLFKGGIALIVDQHTRETCLWCQSDPEHEVFGYRHLQKEAALHDVKVVVGWSCMDLDHFIDETSVVLITHEEAKVVLLPEEQEVLQQLLSLTHPAET